MENQVAEQQESNVKPEKAIIGIHGADKIHALLKNIPHKSTMVAVNRHKLGLIFYRPLANGRGYEANYQRRSWQKAKAKTRTELEEMLLDCHFILVDIAVLQKELELNGLSDEPIPVLLRLDHEIGAMVDTLEMRKSSEVKTAEYWQGQIDMIEMIQHKIRAFNQG